MNQRTGMAMLLAMLPAIGEQCMPSGLVIPDGTIANSGWAIQGAATAHEAVDETIAAKNQSDYIWTLTNGAVIDLAIGTPAAGTSFSDLSATIYGVRTGLYLSTCAVELFIENAGQGPDTLTLDAPSTWEVHTLGSWAGPYTTDQINAADTFLRLTANIVSITPIGVSTIDLNYTYTEGRVTKNTRIFGGNLAPGIRSMLERR